jgi:hypothetical protein
MLRRCENDMGVEFKIWDGGFRKWHCSIEQPTQMDETEGLCIELAVNFVMSGIGPEGFQDVLLIRGARVLL